MLSFQFNMSSSSTNNGDREMSVFEGGDAQYVCRVCSSGDSHPLAKCLKFLAFRTEDRIRAVALYKYCANCLAHTHYGRGCSSTSKCHKCRGDHHTFLHERDSSAKEAEPLPLTRIRQRWSRSKLMIDADYCGA